MTTIAINPPPKDRCCECCGRHTSELKPFGKEGDPLVGNFDGALIIKTFRPMALPKSEKELNELPEEDRDLYEQVMNTISASWECRDCVVLFADDYFKKKFGVLK